MYTPKSTDQQSNILKYHLTYEFNTNIYKNHLMFNSANKRLFSIVNDLKNKVFNLEEGYEKLLYIQQEYEYILKSHKELLAKYDESIHSLEQPTILTKITNVITSEDYQTIPTYINLLNEQKVKKISDYLKFEDNLRIFKKLGTKLIDNNLTIERKSYPYVEKATTAAERLINKLDNTFLYIDFKKCINSDLKDKYCGPDLLSALKDDYYLEGIKEEYPLESEEEILTNYLNVIKNYKLEGSKFEKDILDLIMSYEPQEIQFTKIVNLASYLQKTSLTKIDDQDISATLNQFNDEWNNKQRLEAKNHLIKIEQLLVEQKDNPNTDILGYLFSFFNPNVDAQINDIIDNLLNHKRPYNEPAPLQQKLDINLESRIFVADIKTILNHNEISYAISFDDEKKFLVNLESETDQLNKALDKLECYMQVRVTNVNYMIDKCDAQFADDHSYLLDQAISIQIGEIINHFHNEL